MVEDIQQRLKSSELNEKEAVAKAEHLTQQLAEANTICNQKIEEANSLKMSYQQKFETSEKKREELVVQLKKELQESQLQKEHLDKVRLMQISKLFVQFLAHPFYLHVSQFGIIC